MGRYKGYGTVKGKCPLCSYTKDIRLEKMHESDKTEIWYYRCKDCSFMWGKDEKIKW